MSDIKVKIGSNNNITRVRLGSENAIKVESTSFSNGKNLYELSDVDTSNGQTNGMVLVYNSETLKWQATANPILQGTLTVNGNTKFGQTNLNSHSFLGITTFFHDTTIGKIKISSNIISSDVNSGGKIYIDPYPDGLSNEGTVIIKGNLQVDGNTTTINSNVVDINQPTLNLGDITSVKTVIVLANAGVSTIFVDSVSGVNTGDVISGNQSIPNNSIVQSYNSLTNSLTIDKSLTNSILPSSQITITHNYDTNTDRGITFNYNSNSITKKGFFGYKDNTSYFTFIPDAVISNGVVSGTKGIIDVGGIILSQQDSQISTRGVAYFDSSGKLTSTQTPGTNNIDTTNYVLTTNSSGVPVWSNKFDGGKF